MACDILESWFRFANALLIQWKWKLTKDGFFWSSMCDSAISQCWERDIAIGLNQITINVISTGGMWIELFNWENMREDKLPLIFSIRNAPPACYRSYFYLSNTFFRNDIILMTIKLAFLCLASVDSPFHYQWTVYPRILIAI